MFDALLRELKRLDGMQMAVNIPAGEDGYLDRMCPEAECRFAFKVHEEDWRSKVRDEAMFCPFCRHSVEANEWATEEQVAYARTVAFSQVQRRIRGAIQRDADQW